MNKKEYMQPSMKVVKIKTTLLTVSTEASIYNEKSNNVSYTREGSWMEEE